MTRSKDTRGAGPSPSPSPSPSTRGRSVAKVVPSIETLEGAGFLVHRPFPGADLDQVDPFLLLDEMGPMDLGPGEAKGAPDHPHRGFETVTYVLEGRMEHKDSRGNSGKIGPGDVQWMTAGSGVVHSEMPQKEFLRTGGRMHGFQLWVNLPRKDKMIAPRYQDTPAERIPTVRNDEGTVAVRVVAGEAMGAKAVIDTKTPILYHHWTLQPGGTASTAVPRSFNVFAYVFGGEGVFGPDRTHGARGDLVVFDSDGGSVTMENPAGAAGPLELLLIGGVPLGEPVARYGPFVMNTREEIMRAIRDFQSGRMGAIDF